MRPPTALCEPRCPDVLIGDLGKTVFIAHLDVNDQEASLELAVATRSPGSSTWPHLVAI
jgi:hypothetical protein